MVYLQYLTYAIMLEVERQKNIWLLLNLHKHKTIMLGKVLSNKLIVQVRTLKCGSKQQFSLESRV